MSNETQSPSGNFGNPPISGAPDNRGARVTVVSSKPLPQPPVNAPAAHATLHITLREGGVMERTISAADTRIGKGPDNELILGDAAISSNHALLRFDGKTHGIIDVGSRNGTYLNNARITAPMPLKSGDTIKLGHCTIVFRSLVAAEASAQAPAQTLTLSATEILGTSATPPPPTAPPMPTNTAPPSEDTLARALVNNKLIAMPDMERVQKNLQGRRLYRVLVTEKLATELGLRDLMSRTFNLQLADLRSSELDVPIAQKLNPAFLREKLLLPLTGLPSELTIAVADPTDLAAIEELKKRVGKPIQLRLATGSEIVSKLDAQFTPRLIGVLPSGEKLEVPINQPEISFGKGPHNRIVLNDPTVSTTHATVLVRDGGYSLIDLGSSNGTFVNGQRLSADARTLTHGDKIQLGKVLLTFRNPAETVENKTARLSLEALEEIRRKAGLITGAMPAATGAGASAMLAQSTDASKEDEEEKKRKKKEKEQKEKEKNSITSASNLSRIIAQVMGALIAIIGPIVLYWLGVFGNNNAASNDPGGGKGVSNNTTVAFTPQRVWTKFKSGGFFGKSIEASGAAFMLGSTGLVVVDDGRQGELVWMPLNEEGKQAGDLKAIPLNVSFTDAEAITYGGGYFYAITSQSDPNSPTGKSLMRFSFNPQTQTINGPQAEVISDLRTFLLQNVPEIATRGAAPGLQGGLNIEGIAYDPNNERLLLGLRSPFVGSQAVLVPLRLINPLQPMTLNNLKVDNPPVITLTLEGQGVRDITYDAFKKMFLIISGAPETEKKTDFGLWEWSGNANEPPRKLAVLDEKFKPEGITGVTFNGQNFVMVMGDADSYMRLDYQK